jgi:hypothetical protein
MTGAAFSTGATIPARAFRFVSGQELIKEWQSSPGYFRQFCGRCGSPILKRKIKDPENIRFRLGTLDSDPQTKPAKSHHVGSKAPWFEITGSLPQSD